MAAAAPQPDSVSHVSEAFSGHTTDEFDHEDDEHEDRLDGGQHTNSMRDKDRKIGHRRVDKAGIVSYKKKPTSELMAAIQLGIGQSVGGLSSKPERDVLMQDFGVVEVVFFPGEGSNLTPAHHYSDFRFKTYAPVAFRYFRDLFGIQPDDFMLSLCDEPLKELSNPGASGSIFYLTHDDEFIIKTVQHKEADFLQKLLPGYFLNISQNKRTLLPKFYGLYCYQCGGKNIRFTVMNNLLPSTVKLHEKYDMKGSTYKRKASKHERSKNSPTLKDLDFMENHPDGLQLEKDTYDALIKTLQRDCRVLESFKIMDYSLLVGIYNLDLANKEKQNLQNTSSTSGGGAEMTDSQTTSYSRPSEVSSSGPNALQRGKSFKTRIGQYSTPMESIQGNTDLTEDLLEDEDVPPGGIPARNAKGERLLIYLGIIDILQSFRLKKRLEHTVKSMVIDGDTISVHRPSYYAQRFLQYHATRVFRKTPTALKHSPSKKRSLVNKSRGQPTIPEQPENVSSHRSERTGRTISFSDEPPLMGSGAVGGKPDLLPEYSKMPGGSSKRSPSPRGALNVNGNSRQQKRNWIRSEAFNLSTYPSEDALSAGTASTASLRGVGMGYSGPRGASPPLSLSESTPTHTDFTEDMGSTNPLDSAGLDSPARSPARSPDLRYHGNKAGRGGATPGVSSLARSSQSGQTVGGTTSSNLTVKSSEEKGEAAGKDTPDSPSKRQTDNVKVTVVQTSPQSSSSPSPLSTTTKITTVTAAATTLGAKTSYSETSVSESASSSSPTGPTVEEISAIQSETTRL